MATMSLAEMFKMKLSEQEREEQQTNEERLKRFKEDAESALPGVRDRIVKCLHEMVHSESFYKKDSTFLHQGGTCIFEGVQWNWHITVERGSDIIVRILFDVPSSISLNARGNFSEVPWSERSKILREVIGGGVIDLFPVSEWSHQLQFEMTGQLLKVCVLGAALK